MTDRTAPRKTNDSTLAKLRMERGLTQSQLADLVGCSTQHISRWERGERHPGSKSLLMLAAALKCSIDEILK